MNNITEELNLSGQSVKKDFAAFIDELSSSWIDEKDLHIVSDLKYTDSFSGLTCAIDEFIHLSHFLLNFNFFLYAQVNYKESNFKQVSSNYYSHHFAEQIKKTEAKMPTLSEQSMDDDYADTFLFDENFPNIKQEQKVQRHKGAEAQRHRGKENRTDRGTEVNRIEPQIQKHRGAKAQRIEQEAHRRGEVENEIEEGTEAQKKVEEDPKGQRIKGEAENLPNFSEVGILSGLNIIDDDDYKDTFLFDENFHNFPNIEQEIEQGIQQNRDKLDLLESELLPHNKENKKIHNLKDLADFVEKQEQNRQGNKHAEARRHRGEENRTDGGPEVNKIEPQTQRYRSAKAQKKEEAEMQERGITDLYYEDEEAEVLKEYIPGKSEAVYKQKNVFKNSQKAFAMQSRSFIAEKEKCKDLHAYKRDPYDLIEIITDQIRQEYNRFYG